MEGERVVPRMPILNRAKQITEIRGISTPKVTLFENSIYEKENACRMASTSKDF